MTPVPPVLSVSDLMKSYDGDVEVHALRGVDIAAGEFVAVVGPSGCGKSTLLHVLAGLARPTSGTATVSGKDLARLSDSELADVRRYDVGVVFQAFNLVPVLSVSDNVALPGVIAGRPRRATADRVAGLLDVVGLSAHARKLPGQLSGGEQQRVAIARALVLEPAVLLADEPTGNLDSATGMEILRLFRQLHRDGQTIVVVTHDSRVAGAARRILFMRDGLIVREQPIAERSTDTPFPVVDLDDLAT